MNKILIALLLSVPCVIANAAESAWHMFESRANKGGAPNGYIYYTNAVGTQIGSKTSKVGTSLRLICSAKGDDSVIALLWDTADGATNPQIIAVVDNNTGIFALQWKQTGKLFYRNLNDSNALVQALTYG